MGGSLCKAVCRRPHDDGDALDLAKGRARASSAGSAAARCAGPPQRKVCLPGLKESSSEATTCGTGHADDSTGTSPTSTPPGELMEASITANDDQLMDVPDYLDSWSEEYGRMFLSNYQGAPMLAPEAPVPPTPQHADDGAPYRCASGLITARPKAFTVGSFMDPWSVAFRSWHVVARLPERRAYFAAAPLGESLLICGGLDCKSRRVDSLERVSLPKGVAHQMPPLPVPRSAAAGAALDGVFYICGGWSHLEKLDSVEFFDPNLGAWCSTIPPMSGVRCGHSMLALNGALYVMGGFGFARNLATVERLDPREGKWSRLAEMLAPRFSFATAALDGQIFVAGGCDGREYLADCECYDPRVDEWTPLPQLEEARAGLAMASLEGVLYACGGQDKSGALSVVERFDPDGAEGAHWTTVAPMARPRCGLAVVAMGPHLYALGGQSTSIERFGM